MKKQLLTLTAILLTSCTATQPPTTTTTTITTTTTNPASPESLGWQPLPLKYEVQHPYDLPLENRYSFDPATNTHDFWVFFTDQPHAPPPNTTDARTEMRIADTYTSSPHMLDEDLFIKRGTNACIFQVFGDARGPILMLIANPDGTITGLGRRNIAAEHMTEHWFHLRVIDDPDTKKIEVFIDGKSVGQYDDSRNDRAAEGHYLKTGVYSRRNSTHSEILARNITYWIKPSASSQTKPATRPQ